ncbi:MAG TPA: aminoglycoside phosphotransferase family protein [Lachnospiraceae bacterium]|nr:aminoglycoside phosphotransferase family protein [Lachnospiraceae bacterium]
MKLENLISKGVNASVYKDGDYAIKVFNKGFSKTEVFNEALNTSRVEETGLAIPSIKEISLIDGQWAISMNFIEGKTLAQIMQEDPANASKYVEQMVDLQMEIHSKRSPKLNKLKDKIIRQINSLDCIDSIKKYDLLTILDRMPKHVKVCHGDFNPHNIIVSGDKLYVLDWVHATQGNASADVARTYLLLAIDDVKVADMYLETFCKKSKTDKRYVQDWFPIVAAAQLTKNRPLEKDLLMKWLDVIDFQG